jgi:hypothetical protein
VDAGEATVRLEATTGSSGSRWSAKVRHEKELVVRGHT